MARTPSYNALVRIAKYDLVNAAQSVHESYREYEGVSGAINCGHRACCPALNTVNAIPLAREHFRRLFKPANDDIAYWFGMPDQPRAQRARNLAKRDKRVTALLLAAASLE